METEMNDWNYNIDEAPRFKMVTKRVKTKDGFEDREVKAPVKIIGCIDNPEKWVAVTYWTEPTTHTPKGRWSGATQDQELLAWMPMPEHPMNGN
jgi:hypothetical protein